MNDFLLSAKGKQYLIEEYVQKARSTYDIAVDNKTYPNKVRRALKFHRLPLRSKSQAQKAALSSGRHCHPTKGHPRSVKEKTNISDGMAEVWQQMPQEERERRVNIAKANYAALSLDEQKRLNDAAVEGMRKAAVEGSRLEKYLVVAMKAAGYKVQYHGTYLIASERMHIDMLLVADKIAIEVDGKSHHVPLWGEEALARIQAADQKKTGLLLQRGYRVIRIKDLTKQVSDYQRRKVLKDLMTTIEAMRNGTETNSLIHIEVK